MQNRRYGNCGCNNYSPVYQNNYREEEAVEEEVNPADYYANYQENDQSDEFEYEYENEESEYPSSYSKSEKGKKEHCQFFKEKKYWVEECVWKKCCKFRPVHGPKCN